MNFLKIPEIKTAKPCRNESGRVFVINRVQAAICPVSSFLPESQPLSSDIHQD